MRIRSKATMLVAGAAAAYVVAVTVSGVHAQQNSKPVVAPTSLTFTVLPSAPGPAATSTC